jgi:hypothetical protein
MVGFVAATSLVSCTKPGTGSNTAPTPTQAAQEPYLTEDEASAIMVELSEVNNEANAGFNSDLLATYEAESSFEIDNADYKIKRAANAKPAEPFTYTLRKAYIPAGSAYPQWILVDCTFDDSSIDVAVVLTREKAGADWKFVLAVVPEGNLPEVDTDANSNPVVVDPDDAGGMVDSPAAIAKAQATYLTEGAESEEAKMFGTHRRATAVLGSKTGLHNSLLFLNEDTAVEEKAPTSSFNVTVAPYPIRALRTRDGGALAFYTTRMEFVAEHPRGVATIAGDDEALAGKNEFQGKMTLVALDQWIVYIPPMGGGKVELLGNLTGRVSIT